MKKNTADFGRSILSSFAGSCARLLRRERFEAILWLLADHILLTYQSPVYVTMGVRKGAVFHPCFSSLSENDRKFLGLRPIHREFENLGPSADSLTITDSRRDIAISIRCLPTAGGLRGDSVDMLRRGRRVILSLLNAKPELMRNALAWCLASGVKGERATGSHLDQAVVRADKYMDPLRHRIGRALDHIGRTELTESPSGEGLNLFAVIRQPTLSRVVEPPVGQWDVEREGVEYSYTASLCLSESQSLWLSSRAINPIELQSALSPGTRSIADTPLSQGSVDFSLPNEWRGDLEWSRQHYKGEGFKGNSRKRSEDILYQMAFDGADYCGAETIFYIPVHLSGIPWLALFSFNQAEDSAASMFRNYLLYRDLVPLLSESISLAAQSAFADSLGAAAVRAFEMSRGLPRFVDEANEEWSVIHHFYPYQRVRLSIAGSEGDCLDVGLGDLGYKLYLSAELPGCGELPYRLLDLPILRRSIQERLQQAVDHFQGQFKEALFVFGHHAGKLFQESGLPGLDTQGDPRLTGMKHRLFAAWGMSAAIRPLKNPGRGLPPDWFPQEFSLRQWVVSPQEIVERVADICRFYLATIADKLEPDWTVLWEVEGRPDCEVTFKELATSFGEPLRGLPPLGASEVAIPGTLALTLGLAEIIRNARAPFILNKRDFIRGIDAHMVGKLVMRVRVESQPHDQACTVSIANIHIRDEAKDLYSSTIEQIQRLERTALASNVSFVREFERRVLPAEAGPIVETSQASLAGVVNDYFDWVSSRWSYFYGNLKNQVLIIEENQ